MGTISFIIIDIEYSSLCQVIIHLSEKVANCYIQQVDLIFEMPVRTHQEIT